MNSFIALFQAAVKNGVPLLFGTTGEILTQKSGNMNLGVEGLMYMGGAFGLAGAYYYDLAKGEAANPLVALLLAFVCAFAAGCLGALIFSFLTISLRANQNVTGLALTIFGTGVGQFVGEFMRIRTNSTSGYVSLSNRLKPVFIASPFPQALQDIPAVGPLLFSHSFAAYLGIAVAVGLSYFLNHTKKGLYLRAVGENPATADAAGISVEKYKYIATIIGGGISAVGGMIYTMTIGGTVWNHIGLSGEGWIAVALVIFCLWKPVNSIWGSAVFGALMILYLWLPLSFIPAQIYKVIQYIFTMVVLIIVSMLQRRENQPPASLGIPYFREER